MKSFLIHPTQCAQPHALPFRVMFEEARRGRADKLLAGAEQALRREGDPGALGADEVEARLRTALRDQEHAYQRLATNDTSIAAGKGDPSEIGNLLESCRIADKPLKEILHSLESNALCLSGGGIRSASFGLGVLEGLSAFSTTDNSTNGLMFQLGYLSTVSGGGYIGSWMTSWIYRRKMAGASSSCVQAYHDVIRALAGRRAVTAGDPEPQAVRHLRAYTSYLAPTLGLSLDAFTLAAIILRNLLVNWVMLVPVVFALIAAVKLSGFGLLASRTALLSSTVFQHRLVSSGVMLLLILAAFTAAAVLPSHYNVKLAHGWRQYCVTGFLVSVPLACWLLTISPVPTLPREGETFCAWFSAFWPKAMIALVGYGMLAASIWDAYRKRLSDTKAPKEQSGFWRQPSVVLVLAGLAVILISALTSELLLLVQWLVFPHLMAGGGPAWLGHFAYGDRLFLVFALPLILSCVLITTSLFCALLGLFEMEEDREWWVRAGGWLLRFCLAWIVAHGIAFYGEQLQHRLWAGAAGLGLGLLSSLAGYSSATAVGTPTAKTAELGKIGRFLQRHNLLLPALAGLAIALIGIGMVAAEEAIRKSLALHWLNRHASSPASRHQLLLQHQVLSAAALLLIFALFAVLINLAININLFSLHGMYRMRLMRAFLGASNLARQPDPFTNFDPKDTPHETDLPSEAGVPLHVINATLNLVGTKNTAWRQRKAESFTFSPIHCGAWRVAYAPTSIYGGARGATLATALSISGAAFNPNMGYQSSPLLSLLMTFFNLRLGVWLPNPKDPAPKLGMGERGAAFLSKSGPSFALKPLVAEALGLTDDNARWVELTDGGHFENLGLYEMVMRRCKYIIVSDAGADPHCQFEDLGNAIRKIRIDLGVPIVFRDGLRMEPGMKSSNAYCAVARIEYQWTDEVPKGSTPESLVGYLIYIKSSLTGREPADILQYAKTHATFPNETTGNQFFNESQFESYRHLGFHEINTIATLPETKAPTGFTLEHFMEAAKAHAAGMVPPEAMELSPSERRR
jgi:hypothetical protein